MSFSRRKFVCGCSAAIAAMSGSSIGRLAFGAPGTNDDALVIVFLRGGMDGLSFMAPSNGHPDRGFYEASRPSVKLPNGSMLHLGNGFGTHPSAAPIGAAWNDGNLAFVHACGLTTESTRSHFDAQEYMELGTPGILSTGTGWLTRHIESADNLPAQIVMPSLAVGSFSPSSLRGSIDSVNMSEPSSFNIDEGPSLWAPLHKTYLRNLYEDGNSQIHLAGVQALDAIDVISNATGGYTPANGSATFYNNASSFGDNMSLIAQMLKNSELGLRVATVDLGGWDTHNDQTYNGVDGVFNDRISRLCNGLGGFYRDLDTGGGASPLDRTTVVVMSEFGRRLPENGDRGTDHGHGNLMVVMGGKVNGGVHGVWPGLANGQLFDGNDLAVTTDYRRVLSEILVRRLGNPKIEEIFPAYGFQYQNEGPLGVVEGTDLPIDVGSGELFSDGFEFGDFSRWV